MRPEIDASDTIDYYVKSVSGLDKSEYKATSRECIPLIN